MRRSNEDSRTTWIVGAVILVALLVFSRGSALDLGNAAVGTGADTGHLYTYPGPSDDYAATPHPWSFTHSSPDSAYHLRDADRYLRWEEEKAKEEAAASTEWARVWCI